MEPNKSPSELIQIAITSGTDLDKLEKLLNMQERWELGESKKAFSRDFAKAQSEIEPVIKKAVNPQTHSKYALLENINEVIKPIYTKYGFSVTFNEIDSPSSDYIRLLACVKHYMGHAEEYRYDSPFECTGLKGNSNMTKTHGKASAVSYGRRYLLCMIFNISTVDIDGIIPKEENKIDKNKIELIEKLIKESNINKIKFLEYLEVDSIENIPVSKFLKAKLALEQKRQNK
jgi:hypothetical protein